MDILFKLGFDTPRHFNERISMGSVKDNMRTSCSKSSDSTKDSFLGKMLPRKKTIDKVTTVEFYADGIEKADKKLGELIILKNSNLANEKGQELKNTLQLGNLKLQQMHLDAIIELMNDYEEIT